MDAIPTARRRFQQELISGPNIERHRHRLEQMVWCPYCNAIMFLEERVKNTKHRPEFSLCCGRGQKRDKTPTWFLNNPMSLLDRYVVTCSCCCTRILELQEDFMAQRSLLEEIADKHGQQIIFYPKYHCELNFIEMFWGASKRYTRANCDYTFKGLQETIPAALASVTILSIRKYARRSFRYMDAYRKGLSGRVAELQAKKYKSHRRIPANWDLRTE
ncbi:hypothetical protein BCR41DRAFT_396467 [Lobosporangium transversale]|uniref:Tc1-like transposase DDE domain-containing protein n=1 Tax=Lobosporangium transversale TaxID=64571 RepID=A0A1Y2GP19_9FUNG|nr:hypothetical protein BCR41DRAFT_396467 [Lobosporangium transversale]ORZ15511.1 hypothetical protein BCR41DRAFT_396467 [Lobosporangium transversale]|eukprot:XP_021881259.1 hypothetical protein BCR41DRAFT_396467 [Lobosporangium transversale]